MENIIPRWEWRTFGHDFGEAEHRFAALSRKKRRTATKSTCWPPVPMPTSRSGTSCWISSSSNAWMLMAWNSGARCSRSGFPSQLRLLLRSVRRWDCR